jgi:hypothetical protein
MKNALVNIILAITVSALAFGSAGGSQTASESPEQVSFPTQDGGLIYANLYGEGDRGVVLAHSPIKKPEQIKGRKLFIVSRDDANDAGLRLPRIREQYEKAPDPKDLVILEGSAHAQFIFATDQGERLMTEILRFLSAR